MVPHNRVHHLEGIGEGLEVFQAMANLGLAAQKAGIDGVKGQTEGFIVAEGGEYVVGQVPHGHVAQAPCVGGEDCGGDGADLHPHGGEGGDDDSEGTAAEAGYIVDGGHTAEAA